MKGKKAYVIQAVEKKRWYADGYLTDFFSMATRFNTYEEAERVVLRECDNVVLTITPVFTM